MERNDLDQKLELWVESLTRQLDRRSALKSLSQWGLALVSGLVLGSRAFEQLGAQAVCTSCNPPLNRFCGEPPFNKDCPNGGGCPSGCSICTTNQGSGCIYPQGYWSRCTAGGYSEILCYDCKCGPGFTDTCGCQSLPIPAYGCGGGGPGCKPNHHICY